MPVINRKKATAREDDPARLFVEAIDAIISRLVMVPPSEMPPRDLSPQEFRSLMWIGRHPGCMMTELSRGLAVPFSTATSLVDRLVEKGYLQRQRSDRDRRLVEVHLSDVGKRLDKRFYDHRLSVTRKLFKGLSDSEQRELIQLLHKSLLPGK